MSFGKLIKKILKLPLLALIGAAKAEVERWKQGGQPPMPPAH